VGSTTIWTRSRCGRSAAGGRTASRPPWALAADVERWLADQPVAAQRSAVAALARKVEEHPDDAVLAEQLARQRTHLGLMLTGMGRDADAVGELEAAAAAFAKLSAADPSRPRYRAEEANCYLALAQPLGNLGRPADATAREKQAGEIYNGLIAAHPEEYRANVASIMVTPRRRVGLRRPPPRPPSPRAPSGRTTAR